MKCYNYHNANFSRREGSEILHSLFFKKIRNYYLSDLVKGHWDIVIQMLSKFVQYSVDGLAFLVPIITDLRSLLIFFLIS